MVGCYLRVSPGKRQKTASQRPDIERWLSANHVHPKDVTWFVDEGESSKTLDRPELRRLQKLIFEGKIKTVVIWKLDRLSRRILDGVQLLGEWCERGVRVVSVSQQIDLSGPVGRMVAALLFGVAEIELEYRRERQAAGIAVAKSKGVYEGRKKGTFKGKPGRARQLRERGLSLEEVAKSLGVSRRTVQRYVSSTSTA
jgi:DNA invertase Pin-like site-specific DNA recombinase